MVVAACTSGDGTTQEPAASGTQESVTLSFWLYDEGYHFLADQVVPAFEAKYPNIHIDVTPYPETQYQTKIDTALAAGAQPDLALMANRLWMKESLLLPLDDMVKQQGIDLSTFSPSIVGAEGQLNADEGCAYEGKLYCLGSYTGSVQMFYNEDMFDAAGISYPEPWPPMTTDEFVDLACRLTDPDNGVYGAAYGDPITWNPWEMVVSPDGRTATGYVNGPTSVHVHEVLARGIQDRCAPSLNVLDPWEQGADFFAQGKLAMVVTDFQSLFKIEKAGINYEVTAPPTPTGLDPFFNVWTDSVGVLAGTGHAQEAEQFIAFLATDAQRLRVETAGDMPLDTAVAKETNWAGDTPGRLDALEILPHARPAVFIPNRWDTYGPIFDAFGLIVGEEKTAQEALDQAAPAVQENLDKAWRVWESA
jgi:ABC-type glycerol-3-phosphate transport system substrate-binding protein